MRSAGVDLILLESQNCVSEARAVCEAARASGLPVWVSFAVREDGRLLSKESLAKALQAIEPLGAEVVMVNCAPPDDVAKAVATLRLRRRGPFGAFAHIGRYDPPSWKFGFYPRFSGTEAFPPERYLQAARRWKKLGAQVIGGCCGTTPDHIRALRDGLWRNDE
jgi:S-methylmethionine-dependent homocysteine/selenocysteine methylase